MKTIVKGPDNGQLRSKRLLETKVFDAEFYAAQAGREFDSKGLAARHFVQFGMKAGISLHPLFDLSYFPKTFRDRYRLGDVEYVLEYLKSSESREHLWSPLFDPGQMPDIIDGTSRLLSKFREGTSTTIPLPSSFWSEAPTWSQVRTQLIDHALLTKSYAAGKRPLRYKQWPQEVEDAWITSVDTPANALASGTRPTVSIIMPAYNRAVPIREAIDSVRNQSLSAWELIVVDDGSTDSTCDVVRAYSLIDSRIKLVETEHSGVCAARNAGIANAAGEYLAFLDSDNTWRADFLKLMISGLRADLARAAYCGSRLLNERNEYTGQPVDAKMLLVRNYVDLNVLVAETSLIRSLDGFDEELRRWVDHDLVLRIVKETPIAYFPFIGCDYVDDDNDDRITRRESSSWQYAVLGKNIESWLKPVVPYSQDFSAKISIVLHVSANVRRALDNLRCLVESDGVKPWQITIVEDIQDLSKSLELRAATSGLTGLRYIKLPRQYTRAIACNIGASHTSGESILFVREGVELRPESVPALVAHLECQDVAAVQPAVTDSAGVVLSAGSLRCRNSPAVPLFRGFAVADAQRHGRTKVDELSSSAFVVRADVFKESGRFNPIFEGDGAFSDLFARISTLGLGSLIVDPGVIVVDHDDDAWKQPRPLTANDLEWIDVAAEGPHHVSDHYREAGLRVQSFVAPQFPGLQPAIPVFARSEEPLRWAIKIGADFTIGGDRWGDVPYARDLADALRMQGQEVVIDRAGAFNRPSNHLDDVVLVIRGLHPCQPQPGKINVLWAISRPDLITRSELRGFDVVYGASRIWCDYVYREWGVKAIYLPQATNPLRFYPRDSFADTSFDLAFVGGPRKPIGRKVVADCLEVGHEVNVWGSRWDQYVPQHMVVSDFVNNDELVNVYQSSRIVLNDHFADMAAWGFANNRLYDAVASGARVISDDVDGIAEIFGGAVQTYRNHDELLELLSNPSVFPDDEEMLKISHHIRESHNFERRAEVLVEGVRSFSGSMASELPTRG